LVTQWHVPPQPRRGRRVYSHEVIDFRIGAQAREFGLVTLDCAPDPD
jgi:hypothetical protein